MRLAHVVASSWMPFTLLAAACGGSSGSATAPPPADGGACVLATLEPPLACSSDATCAPYGGSCEFPALNGPGECVCGQREAGCTGPGCGTGVCTLPSFAILCTGPSDTSTCAQYDAVCAGTGPYECACVSGDPPGGFSKGP